MHQVPPLYSHIAITYSRINFSLRSAIISYTSIVFIPISAFLLNCFIFNTANSLASKYALTPTLSSLILQPPNYSQCISGFYTTTATNLLTSAACLTNYCHVYKPTAFDEYYLLAFAVSISITVASLLSPFAILTLMCCFITFCLDIHCPTFQQLLVWPAINLSLRPLLSTIIF